ncbi:MAG: ABC transporter permease [Bacillota bacterium]
MKTFNAYIKKEILESMRQYRYIMLAAAVLFFSFADPIMMKLLPKILESQMNADISALFVITRKYVVQSYIGNLVELGYLVVILVISGTLSDEVYFKKLVFPFSKGGKPIQLVAAKFVHYSITMLIIVFAGFAINYYYTDLLITGESINMAQLFTAACLVGVYMIFGIALAIFFSSLFKRGLTAGILTLAFSYGMIALSGIKAVSSFMPYKLIEKAHSFTFQGALPNMAAAAVFILLMLLVACYRMNKIEII